ncbi:hypothetical protein ACQP3J_31015, partial [Escherichia coli]
PTLAAVISHNCSWGLAGHPQHITHPHKHLYFVNDPSQDFHDNIAAVILAHDMAAFRQTYSKMRTPSLSTGNKVKY